jgi:hypothetical protein
MSPWLDDPKAKQAFDARESDPMGAFGAFRGLREKYGWDNPDLAGLEHEAFMRAWVNDNPITAIPSGIVAPYAYQLAKLLGIRQAETAPSLYQLGAGYSGYLQGLQDLFR